MFGDHTPLSISTNDYLILFYRTPSNLNQPLAICKITITNQCRNTMATVLITP